MIESDINVYWLKLPLAFPYKLSFATVKEYDCILFLIKKERETFWGEGTALPGYSRETAISIWQAVTGCIRKSGNDIESLRNNATAMIGHSPFAACVILTAVEKYLGLVSYDIFTEGEDFPLAGLVTGESAEELVSNVEKSISYGYDTLKIKLSNDVEHDVRRVKAVQEAAGSRVRLRLDANQSYDYDMAVYLLKELLPDGIELFEQPFVRNAWHLVKALVNESPVPIMLDESIWTADDIEKAVLCGVKHVKLKIMKHGGIQNTLKLAELARRADLNVILGNGVQTDLGCIDECYVYKSAGLKCAGEMNGFLKLRTPMIPSGISSGNGRVIVNSIKARSLSVTENAVFKSITS